VGYRLTVDGICAYLNSLKVYKAPLGQ
jgi:hypothetical protein